MNYCYYKELTPKASMEYGDWQIGIYSGPTGAGMVYPMACVYEKYIGDKNAETIEVPAFPPLAEFGEKYEDAEEIYSNVCFMMEGALDDAVRVRKLYLRKPKRLQFGYICKPQDGKCSEYYKYTHVDGTIGGIIPPLSSTVEEVEIEEYLEKRSTNSSIAMNGFIREMDDCVHAPYFPSLRRVAIHASLIVCATAYGGRSRRYGPPPVFHEDRMVYIDNATTITDTKKGEMSILCCAPKIDFMSDEKISERVKLSLIGGYLLYPEYYTADEVKKYEEQLGKWRNQFLEAAVKNKTVRILNKYFEGRKCTASMFEKLMGQAKEYDECYQVLVSNYDKQIDREKEALRKERLDEKRLLNPYMVKNIRESWKYKAVENNGVHGVLLTEYFGDPDVGSLYVPTIVGKKPVIGIDSGAFHLWRGKELFLHDGIVILKNGALSNMECVEKITLPSGLTEIVEQCFENDKMLYDVSLPDTVKQIGENAFCCCFSLKKIDIPKGVNTIPKSCFFQCTGFTEFVVPEHITAIMDNAFGGCSKLKRFVARHKVNYGRDVLSGTGIEDVVFPEGMIEIPDGMFSNSTIKEYKISPDVFIIGNCSFALTKSLTGEIVLPPTVTSIEGRAYMNSALRAIHSEANYVGENAFNSCGQMVDASFPNITHLQEETFGNCCALKRVYCPNVIEIDSGAFGNCVALEELHVGNLSFVAPRAFASQYRSWNFGEKDMSYVKTLKRIFVHNGSAERVRHVLMRYNSDMFESNPQLEIVEA